MSTEFKSIFFDNAYFGIALTLLMYQIGIRIHHRVKTAILSPLILAIFFVSIFLLVFHIDYQTYQKGASYINYILAPATVAYAIPLYRQLSVLKKNLPAILLSVLSGSVAATFGVLLFGKLLSLPHATVMSLMPKSVTTAISLGISSELGGISAITSISVMFTGNLGAIIASSFAKRLQISNPVALGLAIGTSAHAVGTARAFEISDLTGAMSSLSIVVAGGITVVLAPLVASLF